MVRSALFTAEETWCARIGGAWSYFLLDLGVARSSLR